MAFAISPAACGQDNAVSLLQTCCGRAGDIYIDLTDASYTIPTPGGTCLLQQEALLGGNAQQNSGSYAHGMIGKQSFGLNYPSS